VTQKYVTTAICEMVMVSMLMRVEAVLLSGQQVLSVCVEGTLHYLSLQVAAGTFELAGWEGAYLGADIHFCVA